MIINKEQHKAQLTVGDLEKMINALKAAYGKDAKDIPVYIGDDEELNGIHMGIEVKHIPVYAECRDDEIYLRETIKDNCTNPELWSNEVAILIS